MTTHDTITPATLRFERLLDAPLQRVWDFLIDPELRARWFMGGPTDARPGGAITLTMDHDRLSDEEVPTPERYRPHLGHSWQERITRIDPPHLLAFTWEDGAAGEVTFELSEAEDDRTRLILTHTGLRGAGDATDFGGGWLSHLAALERRIRGEGVPDFWALHAKAEATAQQVPRNRHQSPFPLGGGAGGGPASTAKPLLAATTPAAKCRRWNSASNSSPSSWQPPSSPASSMRWQAAEG